VLQARYHDAQRIDAVELNPQVVDLVRRRYADYAGGINAQGAAAGPVRVHIAEARGFVAASSERYDLIQVALLPERNYDALVGYDLVGKILAAEGKLRSSIFDRIVYNAQAVYAPFTSSNNGFGYLFFESVPRLWVPLLVAGFLVAFGAWVRRRTGSTTLAALVAFLVLLPQALLTQGITEARPDLPSMIYVVFAALAVVDQWRGRSGWGAPATLLLVAATARTENLLFGAALAVAVLLPHRSRAPEVGEASTIASRPGAARSVRFSRLGKWWPAVWLVALPTAFFLFWNLFFVKVLIGYDPTAHFTQIDFAPGRMVEIFIRAVKIMAWPQAFGEFVVVVVAAPLGWLAWWWLGGRQRGARKPGAVTPDRPGARISGAEVSHAWRNEDLEIGRAHV
jgi:hypothetical protein